MLIVLSPSKTLDFDTPPATGRHTRAEFTDDAAELVQALRAMSRPRLAKLMDISPKLAELNLERYRRWSSGAAPPLARQALLAFKGDVYSAFDLGNYAARDFDFAQKHLRILSGLYGLLRPLDLIQAYRLEMGTALRTDRGADLYAFWGAKITDAVGRALAAQKDRVLVNLASQEYFGAIGKHSLDARVVSPVFKDRSAGGKYRVLSFFAKRARGAMANHIILHRLRKPADLESFDAGGYRFDEKSSTEDELVFLRDRR